MDNIYIDYEIKNNNEIIKKTHISAVYKKDKYLKFKDNNENINISFNNGNIIMEKDSNESLIVFNFVSNEKTESKYFIKNLNFYIDTKVKTNNLQITSNKIKIEYELWLQDEYSGIFKYQIFLKEIQ